MKKTSRSHRRACAIEEQEWEGDDHELWTVEEEEMLVEIAERNSNRVSLEHDIHEKRLAIKWYTTGDTNGFLSAIDEFLLLQSQASFGFYSNTIGVEFVPGVDIRVLHTASGKVCDDRVDKGDTKEKTNYGHNNEQRETNVIKLYTLKCPGKRKAISVGLRLEPDAQVSSRGLLTNMQILVRGRWHAIKPWLCARYGSQIHRKARIEDWWDMNGKHFRFTDLPAELRCCVYEQVQGQYIWPACIPQVRPLQTVSDHLWHDANVQILDPGKSNIQRTNSLFRREFLKVAWEASWKHFNCTHNLDEVISRLGGAMVMPYGIRVNCLRRINMLLPMEKYFEFVGICPSHEEPFHKRELEPTSSHVRIFRHISTLVFLNFQFEMGTYSDPWTQLASSEGYDYEPACYNVLVEWFFTFAHEHLKGIPRITASGHVKHRTKTKWERIFREEYQDRRSYEMASQIRDLEAMPPRKFPPACYCPTPCHFSEVYLPHPRGVNPGVAQSFVYDD